MEISLKTGIEHRFSLSEFDSIVKLQVLLGKWRNLMEFSHGILKYGLTNFRWMFSRKYKVKPSQKQWVSIFLLENERAGGLTKVLALLLYNSKYFMLKQCLEIKGRDCCRHTFLV